MAGQSRQMFTPIQLIGLLSSSGLKMSTSGTTSGTGPSTSSSGQQSSSSSSKSNRIILLFGYWPPTDIGIDGRHGMLWDWKDKTTITTPKGTSYDLLAISPTFTAPVGTEGPTSKVPFWGMGASDANSFRVDYRDTSDKFWTIVATYRPIAIMSFSRWEIDKTWNLDDWATNWGNTTCIVSLNYYDLTTMTTRTMTWNPPYAGASAQDPAPYKALGPIAGSPPDSTRVVETRLYSNLPETAIIAAVNAEVPGITAQLNDTAGPGTFVSNFLAYHVVWYREAYTGDQNCLLSGHTHVGGAISVADAANAVKAQLKELYKALDAL